MKSIVFKLACVAALAASLTGCIMYVGPHKGHDDYASAPASDEKPAETLPASQSF